MLQNKKSEILRKNTKDFIGIVIASKWDSNGNVIQVSLLTKDEDEFIIEMNIQGNALIPFCQSEVHIKGFLDKNGILNCDDIK